MRLMSWNTRATPVQLEVGPPRPHSRGRCHTKRRNASVRPQGAPRCPAFRPARKTRCRAGHEAGSSGGGKGDEIPDSIPSWNSSSDWRDFRARLVMSSGKRPSDADDAGGQWVHPLPGPETGAILIAHPMMFTTSQTYFSHAVVFLFEHSSDGSSGIMLNRPTEHRIESISGMEAFCPEFSGNRLFLGGDVGQDAVLMLHGHEELQGAIEIINGVSLGGFEVAKQGIADNMLQAENFRFYTRYVKWSGGQLEDECASGIWFPASAERRVILSPEASTGREYWHQVLELIGGDLAKLSSAVRDSFQRKQ